MKTLEDELKSISNIKTKKAKQYAQEQNDAPCSVCGSKEFVQKFRNVVGKISGRMEGYFSLFGGSISGSIDGNTKTLPVLSCRKCENEREIETWKYVYPQDMFWDFMYDFYFKVDRNYSKSHHQIPPFFLERPIETREYALENENYKYKFYNEITEWSPKIWAEAGFKIPKIKKRYFFFWKKEVYPTWKELKFLTNKN